MEGARLQLYSVSYNVSSSQDPCNIMLLYHRRHQGPCSGDHPATMFGLTTDHSYAKPFTGEIPGLIAQLIITLLMNCCSAVQPNLSSAGHLSRTGLGRLGSGYTWARVHTHTLQSPAGECHQRQPFMCNVLAPSRFLAVPFACRGLTCRITTLSHTVLCAQGRCIWHVGKLLPDCLKPLLRQARHPC